MADKHVHKLRRHRFKSSNVVYFCATEDCKYKVSPALAIGKRALCWRCGNPFIMNEYSIRLAKPHCDNCHKPKNEEPRIVTIPVLPSPILQPARIESLTDLRARLTKTTQTTEKSEADDDI